MISNSVVGSLHPVGCAGFWAVRSFGYADALTGQDAANARNRRNPVCADETRAGAEPLKAHG